MEAATSATVVKTHNDVYLVLPSWILPPENKTRDFIAMCEAISSNRIKKCLFLSLGDDVMPNYIHSMLGEQIEIESNKTTTNEFLVKYRITQVPVIVEIEKNGKGDECNRTSVLKNNHHCLSANIEELFSAGLEAYELFDLNTSATR